MKSDVKKADASSNLDVLARLRRQPGRSAWAIQDLKVWPERTTMYFREAATASDDLDYLLITGHPGVQRTKTIVMDGSPEGVRPLLTHLPAAPWVLRETPASLLPLIREVAPEAKVYLEQRMEVTRETYEPHHRSGRSRRLTEGDVGALVDFHGAPPAAAGGFMQWIRGALLYGAWDGDRLVAIASTFVRTPEVWELIGIATRKSDRGKGHATEVTSTLTALALEDAPVVSLTVLKNNEVAKRLYSKLGYRVCEDRIWVDNGANVSPEI